MKEIYVHEKGFSEEDADAFLKILLKYPDQFLKTMFVDEIGLLPPDEEEDMKRRAKDAFTTFLSFVVFGSVPLSVYVFAVLAWS